VITDYYFLSNRISHLEKQIEVLMERLDEVQCNKVDWEESPICSEPPRCKSIIESVSNPKEVVE
jgi:hypothetical protein